MLFLLHMLWSSIKVSCGPDTFKRNTIEFCILFFVLLPSLAQQSCPSVCNCTSISVNCMNRDIETIPNFNALDVEPLTIDLSGNRISIIGSNDLHFKNNFVVKEVYLNDTHLIEIDSKTFMEMENLQELYLGNNLLNSVPANFIEDLSNMVLLDLSGNYFQDDMPVIKSRSLEVLTIINCQITSISVESLRHLANLKLLSLEQNNVHHIEIDTFKLAENKWFLLKLPYNTWHCNCKTIEVFNYLAKNNYIDSSDQYECHANNNAIKIFKSRELENQFCEHKVNKSDTHNNNRTLTRKSLNKYYPYRKVEQVLHKELENKHNLSAEHTAHHTRNTPKDNSPNSDYSFLFFVALFITVTILLYRLLSVEYKSINNSDSVTQLL